MKKLVLCELAISVAGLCNIAEMCPNLEEVCLSWCNSITDAGLAILAQYCSRIHTVELYDTQITDVGATNLARLCPNLRLLDLSGTQATAEGVASLRQAYPALHIYFE